MDVLVVREIDTRDPEPRTNEVYLFLEDKQLFLTRIRGVRANLENLHGYETRVANFRSADTKRGRYCELLISKTLERTTLGVVSHYITPYEDLLPPKDEEEST